MNEAQLTAWLAGLLASGDKVDWAPIVDKHPKHKSLIEQFITLAEIESVMGQNTTAQVFNNESKIKNKQGGLFSWGHLNVQELIGEGAYGRVYRAYDETLEREVALKLLKAEQRMSTKSMQFIDEARMMAKVRHRHVLGVHGAAIYNQQAGMWTDLIPGQNLKQIQQHQPYFSESELHKVASAILTGLQAVHYAGLVHGDIKPSNVMRDNNGEYVLMDFGSSQGLAPELDDSQHHAYVMGTPMLMAPELFSGQSKTVKTDVYAVGVLLYKLASNHYPVEGKNIIDLQQSHESKKVPLLRTSRPDLPKALCAFIHQLISPKSKLRPEASVALNQLQAIIDAPANRHKKLVRWSLLGSMLVGTVVSTVGFYQSNLSKNQAIKAEQQTRQVNQFLQDMLAAPAILGGAESVKVVDVLNHSAKNVATEFGEEPQILAQLHYAIGRSYAAIRDNLKAKQHLSQAEKQWLSAAGQVDDSVLMARIALAEVEGGLNNNVEAVNMLEQVLVALGHAKNKNADLIELATLRMAENLQVLNQTERALQLLQPHMDKLIEPEVAHNNHAYLVLLIMHDMSMAQADFKQAEEVAMKALDWISRWSAAQDIENTANKIVARDRIATSLSVQGKYQQAIEHYVNNVDDAELIYGTENNALLPLLTNWGNALYETGQLATAKQVFIRAQKVALKEPQADLIQRLTINSNLANVMVKLGNASQGESLMRQVLEEARDAGVSNSAIALITTYNLVELLNNNGQHIEAYELGYENHQSMTATFGESHPYTAMSIDNLAISRAGLERFDDAMKSHQQALHILSEVVGDDHPLVLTVQLHQAETWVLAGQNADAQVVLELLVEKQKRLLGRNHPETQKGIDLLSQVESR